MVTDLFPEYGEQPERTLSEVAGGHEDCGPDDGANFWDTPDLLSGQGLFPGEPVRLPRAIEEARLSRWSDDDAA